MSIKPSQKFINDTIKTFSPYYKKRLSEEAIEIINNMGRLIEHIGKMSHSKKGKSNASNNSNKD
ncbi:MAG: hypothetical protein KGK03_06760 [Candidatus Omnitrophica bacterium]|nr:hypothetical protein [Candidatus Omnitrophota bacterium]